MEKRKNYKTLFAVLAVLLLLFSLFLTTISEASKTAFAAETQYTSVLEDLQKDESFNVDEYPDNADDYAESEFTQKAESFYSIHVIQIAESTDGELFVYTYQPSQKTKYLVATQINMSLTDKMGGEVSIVEELLPSDRPKLYNLVSLDCWGVFCKYKVEDFTVSKDKERFYNIASVYRAYDESIDTGSTDESIIEDKAFDVGKLFLAKTENGVVKYECQEKLTVNIINPFWGEIYYPNGGTALGASDCYANFVIFSTDWKIDNLLEADISYVTQEHFVGQGAGSTVIDYDPVYHECETIKHGTKGHNDTWGWFAVGYSWDRIQTVETLKKNTNISGDYISNYKDSDWVVFFTETYTTAVGATYRHTNVTSVTVLRLKFVSNGKTYNLGAVGDKGHSDGESDGKPKGIGFWQYIWNCIVKLFKGTANLVETAVAVISLLFVIVLLPLVVFVLSMVFPAFGAVVKTILKGIGAVVKTILKGIGKVLLWLLKGLWWLVRLPFKGIAAVVRKIKKE